MPRPAISSSTASPSTITERARLVAVAGVVALLAAGPALAHDIVSHAVRELVRIQGQPGTPTPGPGGRQVTFIVLGQRVPFAANEWRVFAFADDETVKKPEAPEPQLVGDRSLLRRVSTARPDQRVTILAERRPGSADLFVLAVDRCPE